MALRNLEADIWEDHERDIIWVKIRGYKDGSKYGVMFRIARETVEREMEQLRPGDRYPEIALKLASPWKTLGERLFNNWEDEGGVTIATPASFPHGPHPADGCCVCGKEMTSKQSACDRLYTCERCGTTCAVFCTGGRIWRERNKNGQPEPNTEDASSPQG